MKNDKIKVYTYTRVSTSMQIDGYSLDAQKARIKAYADYNDYEIVGEYEDAGKSGKSIEGRINFSRMIEDIKSGKDKVSFVLVFKLSRSGMYGNKCIKYKKDGTKYKDFYYYGCKHRNMQKGYKCEYRKQVNEELLDEAVAEVIVKLVSNPKFAAMMQEKINTKVDTAAIEQEIANYEKQLRQHYAVKSKLIDEIDSLNPDDRHYIKIKADLDERLYKMYDKIEDSETQLIEAKAKKNAIEAEKITGDNIYKVLIYFEKAVCGYE